jgi:dihydrofolate reductase/thymidylate synthase
MRLTVVFAVGEDGAFGAGSGMPWGLLKTDMAHFKHLTQSTTLPCLRNVVIMGRRTFESLPGGTLPGRTIIVLSRTLAASEAGGVASAAPVLTAAPVLPAAPVLTAPGITEALALVQSLPCIQSVFVVGGANVIRDALTLSCVREVFVTHVHGVFAAETYADAAIAALAAHFVVVGQQEPVCERLPSGADVTFHMAMYRRNEPRAHAPVAHAPVAHAAIHEEYQYLDLVQELLTSGLPRGDRTGVGTLSKFGCSMRFSLQGNVLPLLTTKRVFWKGVVEELLWFISGSTDALALRERGVNIWDGNSTREFLDSRGLHHRQEGDLGPVYGFQWRHFGAAYTDFHADYTGQGVDQLQAVITALKERPTDRRIIMTAWNPMDLDKMALPPCHMFCQFYAQDGDLSCCMYQRSADVGLGVPFNVASYALLTRMVAQVCDLRPKELILHFGDTHVYNTHVDALQQQLTRRPKPFPTLIMDPDVRDIDAFRAEHFALRGYDPHPAVKMPMAV